MTLHTREFGVRENLSKGNCTLQKYDLYIGACGSDERAYQSLRILKNNLPNRAFFFSYYERTANLANEEKNRYDTYKKIVPSAEAPLPCSDHDISCQMRQFIGRMGSLKDNKIALDISVLTKPYFFATLRALKEYLQVSSVDVFYTEPSEYLHKDNSGNYAFSSAPYHSIEIPGYCGSQMTRSEKLLIVLLGFEGRASSFILEEVDPKITIPINGFPSYLLHYKDVSIMSNIGVLGKKKSVESIRFAPANDPFETYNTIAEICESNSRYTITISPLGPKPMALGAALYALRNPKVRIAYPLPEKYLNRISRDCGATWLFRLRLD